MATSPLPIKKQVSLHWGSHTIALDVAQDLFSSHQVDRGSKLLLTSLDHLHVPDRGTAVDFGCGYGVLGIAWQVTHPAWAMHYVDRDALAVEFARHNLGIVASDLAEHAKFIHGVMPPEPPDSGFDLVLWNVPGKAGRVVVQELASIVLDGLAHGGLLALVVVHPLAEAMREAAARADVVCEYDEAGKEHTVLHLRKIGTRVNWKDAFESGLFDRPEAEFSLNGERWSLTPVVGLPDYDSLGHSTTLAGELMVPLVLDVSSIRWMVWEPGTGHLPVLASSLWPGASGVVASRDALALRATQRALRNDSSPREASMRGAWSLPALQDQVGKVDVAVVAVPDQALVETLEQDVQALEGMLLAGGTAIFHGGSSELARMERMLARRTGWKAGKRKKYRGSSALAATRVART